MPQCYTSEHQAFVNEVNVALFSEITYTESTVLMGVLTQKKEQTQMRGRV